MQTKKINSPYRSWKNANYALVSRAAANTSLMLRTMHVPVKLASALTLMAFGLLLAGCCPPLTPPSKEPAPVTMPALSQPLPLETYSSAAQRHMAIWEALLIGTL